jgi:hypothetical protein
LVKSESAVINASPSAAARSKIVTSEALRRPISSTCRLAWPAASSAATSFGERFASSRNLTPDGHRHLALVDDGGRVLQGGSHVFTLEVGVVLEQLLAVATRSELAEHHADGDPQSSDAGDPAHLRGVDRDPLERHA